jgi:hypothetical protein
MRMPETSTKRALGDFWNDRLPTALTLHSKMGFRHVPAGQLSDKATPFSRVLGRGARCLLRQLAAVRHSFDVPLNLLATADKVIDG